ncbi:unnamed protein product [Paramecium primaurelia]|uniref:Uncharacterized protein n=1 Tax=Paramecium primaurelia TaxID=5886 RepID=A0A8S1QNJ0_PARPR|nr:unnamed protein product [Paramecium primaurelia]
MGFGDIKRAKQYVAVGILISVLICALCASLFWVFQDGFIDYLQQKEERINIETIPWMIAVFQLQMDYKELQVEHQTKCQVDLVQYQNIFAYLVCCVPIEFFSSVRLGIWK